MLFSDPTRQPRVGVGVMIVRAGKILLGKRRTGYGSLTYGWVGGHLEFGETLEECARRETREETGLELQNLKLVSIIDIVAEETHYVDIEFLAENVNGEPQVLEPENVESWDWYDLNDLPSPLFEAVEQTIKCYSNGKIYMPRGDQTNQ